MPTFRGSPEPAADTVTDLGALSDEELLRRYRAMDTAVGDAEADADARAQPSTRPIQPR